MANQRAAKHGRILRTLGITGTALALAACGGGGGGGSSDGGNSAGTTYTGGTGDAAITSGNGSSAAGSTVDSVTSSAGTSVLGESAGSLGTAIVADGGQTSLSLAAAALEARRLTAQTGGGNLAAGATQSCTDGGSFSYSSSNTLTADSPLGLSFNDCQFGTIRFDGSITLTLKSGDIDTNSYDFKVSFGHFIIAQNGNTLYGANGAIRMRSGSYTGVFPSGHDAAYSANADLELNLGDGGTLDIVDHVNDRSSRISDANIFYSDGNNDGALDTSGTWYMAAHGSPMKVCTTELDGCVTLNHSVTTSFTFTGGSVYPTAGIWRVDGSSGYVKLDAGNSDPATVDVTVNGSLTPGVQWTSLASRDFASSLN
ncbi:MAG TPA: hypothetical protein VKA55_04840 [Gammaproteobacteria bacterium]|nr:hypothetical protein [Gammaproteobacteria bacterium]